MPVFLSKKTFLLCLIAVFHLACTECLRCEYQVSSTAEPQEVKKCARKEELEAMRLAIETEYANVNPRPRCVYVPK